MISKKLVLHTDIILEHLLAPKFSVSTMRHAMRHYFCYTTVFNAIELFSIAQTANEQKAIEHVMSSIKILGLNAKSAPVYGKLFRDNKLPPMISLIAGLCMESKLPLLTGKPSEFKHVRGLTVMTPNDILNAQKSK